MQQTTLIILICIVLAAVGVWAAWVRPSKAHLLWRILSTITAVIAFGCLVLPVKYSTTLVKNEQHEAILLTDGFEKDSLKTLANLPLYTLDSNIHPSFKTQYLPDVAALNELQPKITTLHVLGSGLSQEQLKQIAPLAITFRPSSLTGMLAVNHTAQLHSGQRLRVQGQYSNTSGRPVKLMLKGSGTVLDSATLPANRSSAFNLNTIPKATGRNVYQLLAIQNEDTLQSLPLPVTVTQAQPLKVLLLSATPDFENKFLKNWLIQNGYAAAIRSSITKGKTSVEFVNMAQLPLDKLTPANLNKFDVVTADAASLKALLPAENAALYQEVTQKGLGLIIRADSSKAGSGWMQSGFSVSVPPSEKQLTTKLILTGDQFSASAVNINPVYIHPASTVQTVVTDAQQRILAACKLAGNGKVLLTTLTQTFTWALSGNAKDYATVWTALFNKAARKKAAAEQWFLNSALPAENAPVNITVQSGAAGTLQVNQAIVPSTQQALLPFEHTVTYWPQSSGWQKAIHNNSTFYWFAASKGTWQHLQNQQNTKATLLYAQYHRPYAPVTKKMQQIIRIEVPKFYFYVLLLLALTYLWAESRWFSS
ncbi:hypothetical protein GCM10027037_17330 [Mucilaginibacter koreensis]